MRLDSQWRARRRGHDRPRRYERRRGQHHRTAARSPRRRCRRPIPTRTPGSGSTSHRPARARSTCCGCATATGPRSATSTSRRPASSASTTTRPGTNTLSATVPRPGWHALELHLQTGGPPAASVESGSTTSLVADLSGAGSTPGPHRSAAIADRRGPDRAHLRRRLRRRGVRHQPPRAGRRLRPRLTSRRRSGDGDSPFAAQVSLDASTDDVGVHGYDVFRDGTLVTSLSATS